LIEDLNGGSHLSNDAAGGGHRSSSVPDPFADVRVSATEHLAQHGCFAFPFAEGSMLGVLSGAANAARILELGTGLGYTAMWLAHGSPTARIDTIELDCEHAEIARRNFDARGFGKRIAVHQGDFAAILPTLSAGYDLAFFDGFAPDINLIAELHRLLKPRGTLISSNLNIGCQISTVLTELNDSKKWLTTLAFDGGRTAISLRL